MSPLLLTPHEPQDKWIYCQWSKKKIKLVAKVWLLHPTAWCTWTIEENPPTLINLWKLPNVVELQQGIVNEASLSTQTQREYFVITNIICYLQQIQIKHSAYFFHSLYLFLPFSARCWQLAAILGPTDAGSGIKLCLPQLPTVNQDIFQHNALG